LIFARKASSGVAGYGVCGFIGQRSLSKTHGESKPSLSELCHVY